MSISLIQKGLIYVYYLLNENYISDPPRFIIRPDATYVKTLGQSVTMACSAAGTPLPQITWRKKVFVINLIKYFVIHVIYFIDGRQYWMIFCVACYKVVATYRDKFSVACLSVRHKTCPDNSSESTGTISYKLHRNDQYQV